MLFLFHTVINHDVKVERQKWGYKSTYSRLFYAKHKNNAMKAFTVLIFIKNNLVCPSCFVSCFFALKNGLFNIWVTFDTVYCNYNDGIKIVIT
jgi:hypothetical protein